MKIAARRIHRDQSEQFLQLKCVNLGGRKWLEMLFQNVFQKVLFYDKTVE